MGWLPKGPGKVVPLFSTLCSEAGRVCVVWASWSELHLARLPSKTVCVAYHWEDGETEAHKQKN